MPIVLRVNRRALVYSRSLVQRFTLGKIKGEVAPLNILQQVVQCIHPLPFDTSTAGLRQHLKPTTSTMSAPSSSLILSTTTLSSITLLLPRYLDLYHWCVVVTSQCRPILFYERDSSNLSILQRSLWSFQFKRVPQFFFNPNCICPQCLDQRVPVRQHASSCCW